MVAISVRPSKEWGNGSTPASRTRESFSRRSASSGESPPSFPPVLSCVGSALIRRAYLTCLPLDLQLPAAEGDVERLEGDVVVVEDRQGPLAVRPASIQGPQGL